jgi:corrinoid protein of di/trimethylamine methyltransferase
MSQEIFDKLALAVVDGEPEDAEKWAKDALAKGLNPLDCINNGLTRGIQQVGELFAEGEYFLPELVIGGEAMKAGLSILEPALVAGEGRKILGTAVLGTVKGDLHEIGKTLVGTMLTANGFHVVDLGVDCEPEAFVAAAKEHNADLVGASALLTTTMSSQKDLVKAIEAAGLKGKVKVMVGGAPITQAWADEIGADGYAEDAISAVALAKQLVGAPA